MSNIERWSKLGGIIALGSCISVILGMILYLAEFGPYASRLAYFGLIPWLGLVLMLAPIFVDLWREFRRRTTP